MLDQFVVRELHYVFGVDALETSRPINLQVTTPAEISRMFDAISYDKGNSLFRMISGVSSTQRFLFPLKGSCIIRMAADFIGLETFNRGLTRYLTAR
jgi:aminopeptidase N